MKADDEGKEKKENTKKGRKMEVGEGRSERNIQGKKERDGDEGQGRL